MVENTTQPQSSNGGQPAQTPPPPPAQPATPTQVTSTTPSAAKPAQTPPPPPAANASSSSQGAQPPTQHKRHFPLTTIVLIIILAAIAGVLLYFALYKSAKPVQKVVTSTPTPTPYAQALLSFEQATGTEGTPDATLTPSAGSGTTAPAPKTNTKTLTYNVMLTTNADMVNGVQLELGFDPNVVKIDSVTPGNFITNPVQLTKDVNNTTGRISYALGISPNDKPLQGTGIVAVITLEILPGTSATSTTLSFLPKTQVAGAGVNPSVLKSSTDITIVVAQPTVTENPTTGTPTLEVSPTPMVSPTAAQ